MDLSEDVVNEVRQAFSEFDLNDDGHISAAEIGSVMKSLGEEIPGYKLREIIKEVDTNRNGSIEFNEFLQIYKSNASRAKSSKFHQLLQKKERIEVHGGASEQSAEGTKHSMSEAEKAAFSDWINYQLVDDPDCKPYLPINSTTMDLFEKTKDGILLCKMINLSAPKTIDERTINKGKLNAFKIHENQLLVVNSASAIGCSVVNIGAEDLSKGKQHLLLGLLWQIIRTGLFANISLAHNPHLAALLREGETIEDLLKLSPEEILLRWVNYHLEKAGSDKRINNFSSDIADSEAYAILLHRIAPDADIENPGRVLSIGDNTKRAETVLFNADKIGCRKFVRAKDIVQGNPKLNLAFVANLFNHYPALELTDEVEEVEPYEETREEKTFRNWMNSLGVKPYINHLYNDSSNGLIMFQLYDNIKPGLVNWEKVNRGPFKMMGGKMKKIENCNYAVELGKKLGFSLVGIEGKDIHDGNRTLTLGLVWQMMRAYTVGLLQKLQGGDKPISDSDIIALVNNRLQKGMKESRIQSFKDPAISTSLPVVDLVDVIKPGVVDYTLIRSGNDDEDKLLNAQYAVSLCRKVGARIYALPEDLVEVNPKMVLTVFACLLVVDSRSH